MASSDSDMKRLKENLSAAYLSKSTDTGPVGGAWQNNVMRSIRQIGPPGKENHFRDRPGLLAWRLAPVALVLMIILSVLILRVDDTIEYQMASLAVSDPVQTYITIQPF